VPPADVVANVPVVPVHIADGPVKVPAEPPDVMVTPVVALAVPQALVIA
jgi:hypothetical protein